MYIKLYHKAVGLLYAVFLLAVAIYSFVLVDPNMTFINNAVWATIRESLIQFGYYQREMSSYSYVVIISVLFLFHFYWIKHVNTINLRTLAIPIALLGILSYPLLSHDFFNYMFDAKIFTFYHQNPYLHKALDFPGDPWLRFLQWTHRAYPYGPIFLGISIIPSFLSFGKFLLGFLFFKMTFVSFYLLAVYFLSKLNKQWAVFFATNPLVIVEGLVNAHNDLIAVSLAIVGVYYLFKKSNHKARFLLLLSGGIKYITLPFVFLSRVPDRYHYAALLGVGGILIYLLFFMEIQPWYFLALFILLPFYDSIIYRLNIFFAGLLFSYYPYILGGWSNPASVTMKHTIILVFLTANIVYLAKRKFLIR